MVKPQDIDDRQRLRFLFQVMPPEQRIYYGGDFEEWLVGITAAITWDRTAPPWMVRQVIRSREDLEKIYGKSE